MRFLVDFGNTRIKWAQSGSGEWRTGALVHQGQDIEVLLDAAWSTFATPSAAWMVSVADATVRKKVAQWIERRWHVPVREATSQAEQLGVVNHYRQPTALGADRWVALIGARAELPGAAVCVVDCGTAVTVDALTADGEFAGGVIIPGLGLSRSALQRGTAGVRFDEGDETSCLGRSTADAVAAGTLYALAGSIERVCQEFEQSLGESMKLLITGGDADHVAPLLRRPARRDPDLVLRGLDRIANVS